MNKKYLSENWIKITPFLFSLLAIMVSVKSCITADESFKLSHDQYKSEHYIVLTSKIEYSEILLTPADPNIIFQRGALYLPSKIQKDTIEILPPNKSIHTTRFLSNLQNLIKQKIAPKEGTVAVNIDAFIPVVIESYYVAKGTTFGDRSLYFLTFQFVVDDDKTNLPEITFTGLTFIERIDLNNKDYRKELDNIFNSEKGLYIPYNSVDNN
jgi:hypothetical protein